MMHVEIALVYNNGVRDTCTKGWTIRKAMGVGGGVGMSDMDHQKSPLKYFIFNYSAIEEQCTPRAKTFSATPFRNLAPSLKEKTFLTNI
jgi:hypothetical protein